MEQKKTKIKQQDKTRSRLRQPSFVNNYGRAKCSGGQAPSVLRHAQGKARSGQAMLLTVLVLSSTVLALSAIGGYLMLVRLRSSSDIVSTTKAIYIADAGLECAAFKHFIKLDDPAFNCDGSPYNDFLYDGGTPVSGASYSTEYAVGPPVYIRSIGNFRTSNRSFRMDF